MSILVLGGYGVFGSLVCRELVRLGSVVTVAGRDHEKAAALARELGSSHRALALDVRDARSCLTGLRDHAVAVHCAGPFDARMPAVLDACMAAGCHLVDIADDRSWTALVRSRDEALRGASLAAAYGCSSLPGLSGALAVLARANAVAPPERARVTLFIGNDNRKGDAAIRSAVRVLGRPILAPQGELHGFGEREIVDLPSPFGRRTVGSFDSPEYDLFPGLLGVREVAVKVGFESRAANAAFGALARLGSRLGDRTAAVFAWLGRLSRGGSSGGVVLVELFWSDGTRRRAALHATSGGQRMAALPCALAARALETGAATARGAVTAYELLGAEHLVSQVASAGYALERS